MLDKPTDVVDDIREMELLLALNAINSVDSIESTEELRRVITMGDENISDNDVQHRFQSFLDILVEEYDEEWEEEETSTAEPSEEAPIKPKASTGEEEAAKASGDEAGVDTPKAEEKPLTAEEMKEKKE